MSLIRIQGRFLSLLDNVSWEIPMAASIAFTDRWAVDQNHLSTDFDRLAVGAKRLDRARTEITLMRFVVAHREGMYAVIMRRFSERSKRHTTVTSVERSAALPVTV